MDKYVYFFGTVGGLIFIFLVLNQGGGTAAANVTTAGGNTAAKIISTLQGR